MATATYDGVTVQVNEKVAALLPAAFNTTRTVTPKQAEHTVPPAAQVERAGAPAKSASRGEWARYAETIGLDPGDLTKAELIAAINE